jgi:predicted NBD/HSP70 family sugar kinase
MLGVKTAALPASLRRTNQRTVISLLARLGSASRADLAKAAGISQPTAGKITTELLEWGILQPAGSSLGEEGHESAGARRLGRPGQMVRLDDRTERFLIVELGVSETRLAAMPVAVKLADEWTRSFATPKTPEAWLKNLKASLGGLPRAPLWGVVVSVPGIVDESAGKVLFSPNLHWLEQVDFPQLIQTVWELPVLLVQEIRALALGHLAAEPGEEDFFLVDFGEGVGGAIVLEGKLYQHPMPLSGEFGHTPVAGNPRPCGCGAVGCLETLVSERGLLETFSRKESKIQNPKSKGDDGETAVSWPALVRRVTERGIEPWLSEALDATAKVISGALNVLGIHQVVVTGLLTELPGSVQHLAAQIKQGAMWGRFGEVACQAAPRRRAAGLVGVGIDRLVLPDVEERGQLASKAK